MGNVSLNVEDVKWLKAESSERTGEVEVMLNGERTRFEVRESSTPGKPEKVILERRYRRWYGYPAQLLLVVSLPVDAVITVVVTGAVIVFVPIAVLYTALTSP